MVSELAVVVSTDIGLPIVLFVRSRVSGERRLDAAMVLCELRIARNVLPEVLRSRYRRKKLGKAPVVVLLSWLSPTLRRLCQPSVIWLEL